jgi:hypothetical protein
MDLYGLSATLLAGLWIGFGAAKNLFINVSWVADSLGIIVVLVMIPLVVSLFDQWTEDADLLPIDIAIIRLVRGETLEPEDFEKLVKRTLGVHRLFPIVHWKYRRQINRDPIGQPARTKR